MGFLRVCFDEDQKWGSRVEHLQSFDLTAWITIDFLGLGCSITCPEGPWLYSMKRRQFHGLQAFVGFQQSWNSDFLRWKCFLARWSTPLWRPKIPRLRFGQEASGNTENTSRRTGDVYILTFFTYAIWFSNKEILVEVHLFDLEYFFGTSIIQRFAGNYIMLI